MLNMICPECGRQGQVVGDLTVESLVKEDNIRKVAGKGSFYLCREPDCSVVYYNGDRVYGTQALKVPVWFKEGAGEDSPICYCADITRREIRDAVASGRKTRAEIRNYTGKSRRSNCIRKNPAGRCCDQEFDEEIIRCRRMLNQDL